MKQHNFIKFYRVFEHDTSVTEILSNDFRHVASRRFDAASSTLYSLPTDGTMFYGYADKPHAMEMAKAGALKYIDMLIDQGDKSAAKLQQYRYDHYADLNINLVETNIQEIEQEENINKLS